MNWFEGVTLFDLPDPACNVIMLIRNKKKNKKNKKNKNRKKNRPHVRYQIEA